LTRNQHKNQRDVQSNKEQNCKTGLLHHSFGAFMAVKIQVEIFWIVTTCNVVVGYQRFGGPFFLHLQGDSTEILTLN